MRSPPNKQNGVLHNSARPNNGGFTIGSFHFWAIGVAWLGVTWLDEPPYEGQVAGRHFLRR